jgi:hypothetical protein
VKGFKSNKSGNKNVYKYAYMRYNANTGSPCKKFRNDMMAKKKYKIDFYISNKTTKCRQKFSCLTGNNECLCEVVENINGRVVAINPINERYCIYKIPFANSFVCTCPTRVEINNRYNI